MFKTFDKPKLDNKVSVTELVEKVVNDYYVSVDFDNVAGTAHVFIGDRKEKKYEKIFKRCPFSTNSIKCLAEEGRDCNGWSGEWETCENVKEWKETHERT